MNKLVKKYLLALLFLTVGMSLNAQSPVKWSYGYEHVEGDTYRLTFDVKINPPYHIYDDAKYESGINPLTFTIEQNPDVRLIDKIPRTNYKSKMTTDEYFGTYGYVEGRARYTMRVELKKPTTTIKGTTAWQACDETTCLMLEEEDFAITMKAVPVEPDKAGVSELPVPATEATKEQPETELVPQNEQGTIGGVEGDSLTMAEAVTESKIVPASDKKASEKSLWGLVIEAILWGFVALLTPCVFPMVPMTVSYFLNDEKSLSRGRFKAGMYGLFIVLLYTLPITVLIVVTRFVGGESVTVDIFNWLATHWIPNIIFFIVFIVFAVSFFGAFDITMPSKIVNISDKKSGKSGLAGVFFLALTLVLVSFSCTGPIVGTVLIKSTEGEIWAPIVTMFAFSVAFALPFTLFALFPALLKKLPKSGGWLNSVKVVLGFVEVALAFKFLSVADQTYHWGILDREVYLAIWIVIFTLLGLYLLGKLKFKHDSDVKYVSVPRIFMAIGVFSFVVYLFPGMWGAPLKGISGYLPPMHTHDFVVSSGGDVAVVPAKSSDRNVKYGDFLHLPHGLNGYFDFNEALAAANEADKPLFIDFTGHGCVNCREMEARVWSQPEILKLLREEFVIVALYSDDKTALPKEDWITTDGGRELKSLGRVNSYLAYKKFGVNAQPYYLIVDNNGEALLQARGYDLDVAAYEKFLRSGIELYRAK